MKRLITIITLFLTACGTAMDPFVGMQQAEREAQYYSSALTATADVKVFAITQTSAAFAMLQMQTAYPYTATALAWTPTPIPTATPNAAATLVMANAIAEQKRLDNEAELNDLKLEQQRKRNNFEAVAWPIVLLVLLLVIAYVGISISRERRKQVLVSADGDTSKIMDRVTGEIIDMDANPNYSTGVYESLVRQFFQQWLERKYGFQPRLPRITADRQDAVKERDQYIDLKARAGRLPKRLTDLQGNKFLPEPTMPVSDVVITKPDQPLLTAMPELPLPHWKLLNKWDGHLLPFGVDERADLMRVDPVTRPHFMVVGRSRSGKTLSSIRPMVACLLTMGWNVIVMGKRVDFMPFEEHPNFKLISVDVRKDAQKYIDVLSTMTAQMDIRDQLLYSKKVSTWDRYGAPSTMIVVDDYSGALERMPSKRAAEVVSEVKSIAMDGAKFGLNLMIGLQKPTWENIDTTIRSQMGRIVYSVDVGDSRIALGEEGAERLPLQFNFLTRMTDDATIQRGVGFVLQDVEIEAFLKSRPVPANEPIEWVDAKVVPQAQITERTDATVFPESSRETEATIETSEKIVNLYLGYLNRRQRPVLAEIERTVFGKTGGSFHHNTKQAIADFEGVVVEDLNQVFEDHMASWNTTTPITTTENGADIPHFQADVA